MNMEQVVFRRKEKGVSAVVLKTLISLFSWKEVGSICCNPFQRQIPRKEKKQDFTSKKRLNRNAKAMHVLDFEL